MKIVSQVEFGLQRKSSEDHRDGNDRRKTKNNYSFRNHRPCHCLGRGRIVSPARTVFKGHHRSHNRDPAAVLGVVLVVASVGVTIHFQYKAEKERQFQIDVFRIKLKLYQALLDCIVASDDDHVITPCEIEEIRNRSMVVALVGSKQLLETLASFVERITRERQLSSMNSQEDETGTFRAVIQQMREDLDVVEGNVESEVRRLNEAQRPNADKPIS